VPGLVPHLVQVHAELLLHAPVALGGALVGVADCARGVVVALSNIPRLPCADASNIKVCAAMPSREWAHWMLSASSRRHFAAVHLPVSPHW